MSQSSDWQSGRLRVFRCSPACKPHYPYLLRLSLPVSSMSPHAPNATIEIEDDVKRFIAPSSPAPDIKIESIDGHVYDLHIASLTHRSPVFRDMLSLGSSKREKVKLTGACERAEVLDIVMPFVYEVEDMDEFETTDAGLLIDAFEGVRACPHI